MLLRERKESRMKITLEGTEFQKGKKIVIETGNDDHNIWEVYEQLIRPALIAWGYGEGTVDRLTEEE